MRRVFFHGGVPSSPGVYVTTDLMQAVNCARIMNGMIYRVQPIGRLGPDPDHEDDLAGRDYTAPRALILARQALPPAWLKLDEEECHRLKEITRICPSL